MYKNRYTFLKSCSWIPTTFLQNMYTCNLPRHQIWWVLLALHSVERCYQYTQMSVVISTLKWALLSIHSVHVYTVKGTNILTQIRCFKSSVVIIISITHFSVQVNFSTFVWMTHTSAPIIRSTCKLGYFFEILYFSHLWHWNIFTWRGANGRASMQKFNVHPFYIWVHVTKKKKKFNWKFCLLENANNFKFELDFSNFFRNLGWTFFKCLVLWSEIFSTF